MLLYGMSYDSITYTNVLLLLIAGDKFGESSIYCLKETTAYINSGRTGPPVLFLKSDDFQADFLILYECFYRISANKMVGISWT